MNEARSIDRGAKPFLHSLAVPLHVVGQVHDRVPLLQQDRPDVAQPAQYLVMLFREDLDAVRQLLADPRDLSFDPVEPSVHLAANLFHLVAQRADFLEARPVRRTGPVSNRTLTTVITAPMMLPVIAAAASPCVSPDVISAAALNAVIAEEISIAALPIAAIWVPSFGVVRTDERADHERGRAQPVETDLRALRLQPPLRIALQERRHIERLAANGGGLPYSLENRLVAVFDGVEEFLAFCQKATPSSPPDRSWPLSK